MDSTQRIVDDLKATDIAAESISAFKELLEQSSPDIITKIVVENLLPYIFQNYTKNQNEILDLIINCAKIEVKYLNKADVAKFKLQCLHEFVEGIDKLQVADSTEWSILCITLFRILGTALHNDVEIINRVLKSIESGFRNKPVQKCEAYKCWMSLIRNYNLVPSYLKQPKQMRLLIKPLKIPLSKQSCVIEIRFDTFVLLLEAVGNDIMSGYIDFLQFVFNIGNTSACEATRIIPTYRNIWSKSAAVLFQSLGCEGNIELVCDYKTNIGTIVDIKYFENNYKCLVYAARICSELTFQWCAKPNVKKVIEPLWTSIFKLSHNCNLEKNVLLIILEHFNELFRIVSSNDFVYDFILMPILEIIYKNPELNSATFRSDLLIPFLKLYITCTDLHVRSRNDAVANLVSFCYSSNSLVDLYPLLDSLIYCEVLELVWFQCNSIFVSELKHHVKHTTLKSNVLTYLKWPVGNVKYLNTNECILKLWKSTIFIVYKTEPDIITQLLDAFKLMQEQNNWIIVNIMLVGAVLLEVTTRKTTAMECLAVTVNECFENSAKGIEQFVMYKHAFFQSYMSLLKHVIGNVSVLTSMLQSLDRLIQHLPDLIIKSIPRSFVQFMETSSRMTNSIEAVNIITKIRPNALHSTPTIISRSKKMASLSYAPLLPNFSKMAGASDSDQKQLDLYKHSASDKKTVVLSASTDISGFEHNIGSSPNSVKSSFLDKIKNRSNRSSMQDNVSINSRTKSIMDFADNVFVQIDKEVTPDLTRMTTHQRDTMRRRRDDIPAMYSDLSQSQSQNATYISPDTSNTQNSEMVVDQSAQIELKKNNAHECDSEPTLLNSESIIDQPKSTIETDDMGAKAASTDEGDKPTGLLQDENDQRTEKIPRKKLFNDASDTDSNSMDDHVFMDKHPRKDLFNIGKDADSKSSGEANVDVELSKNEMDLKGFADVNNTVINDTSDNSSNQVINDGDDKTKDDVLSAEPSENEINSKSNTKMEKRLTRMLAKYGKYNKSRSLRSKSSKSISPKNIKRRKMLTFEPLSKSNIEFPKEKEMDDKFNIDVLENNESDAILNEVPTKITSKVDLSNQNNTIEDPELSINVSPNLAKIKAINSNNSKNKSKTIKGGKVKFVKKWRTYNNKPAKHITGDSDLLPHVELDDFNKSNTDHEHDHSHSEINIEINSNKASTTSATITTLTEENLNNASESQTSPDIIEGTQHIIDEKVMLRDKLKNELNRLRMDIVGGDMDACLTSKRIRKEKFNLRKPKRPRKPRNRLSLVNNMEVNPTKDDNGSNRKQCSESASSFTSDSASENESMRIDLEQDIAASKDTVVEQPPQIYEDDEKDVISQLVIDSKDAIVQDTPNTESELAHDNNGQQMHSENDVQNLLLNTDKLTSDCTSNEVLEDILERNPTEETVLDNSKENDLPDLTIKTTVDAINTKENIVDVNSEAQNAIMETQPFKETFSIIAFIDSVDNQPHQLETDVHAKAKDTCIGIDEIDTETCNSSCTSEIIEDTRPDEKIIIPSSPITTGTPSKNQTLHTDTLVVSPNDATTSAEELSKCNSPDVFETKIATSTEKVSDDSSCQSNTSEQSNVANIITPDENNEDLIPSSPITNSTPSKNQILLTDTLDVSPIGTTISVQALSKCNSPDVFESEIITSTEKIMEDSSCQSNTCEQNNSAIIVITPVDVESKSDVLKQDIDVPKGHNNPFVSHLAPLKLLTSSTIVSSPKTHRIQKMMQKLGDQNCSNTTDSKEPASTYYKEDLLEFSADVPKPDARPRTPSILKRKASDNVDDSVSPLAKRKRVNFSDPPTTSCKVYLKCEEETLIQRVFKRAGKFTVKPHQNNQNDMNFNIKVNIKRNAATSDTEAHIENEYPESAKVITPELESVVGELSDLYPELIDCTEDVELLHNITNSVDDIKSKGIKTIADIVRLKLSEIEGLPFDEPKFKRVNSALSLYCSKHKNNAYNIQTDGNIHKIITVDCTEKSISNVNIINNIILSPKHIEKVNSFGLAAVSQNIKRNIQQLVNEGYTPDEIGEQLNNILRSCNLPLSINLPYY